MKLNKIVNFILCFIYRIVFPIAFIEINIPEINKNFNRINPSSEYSFPNANKIYFPNKKATIIAGIIIIEIIFIAFFKMHF